MKLLFLAPQPFFEDRGTPIAVRLALEVLSSRKAPPIHIDLLTFHQGRDIPLPRIKHHRIRAPFIKGVRPGFSFKKLLCDVLFLMAALRLVLRSRKQQYALIHAVEESVFIALLIKLLFGVPYVYDMDSSMAQQLVEKWHILSPLSPIFNALERLAIRHSIAVVPVCDALASLAMNSGSREIAILRDISLLKDDLRSQPFPLREQLNLPATSELVVYIGNLEGYQGIDLLLESFAQTARQHDTSHVVIVGGSPHHIARYRERCEALGIADRAHFLGQRPVDELTQYIMQADVLASPRIRGNNTPMKIYSYLHSGKAILATSLETHTQVLSPDVAVLVEPELNRFSAALYALLTEPERRQRLGAAAIALAEQRYTFEVFSRQLNNAYDRIQSVIGVEPSDHAHAAPGNSPKKTTVSAG